MKHLKQPILLLISLAVLSAVLYWDDLATEKENKQKLEENKVVFIAADEFSEISIKQKEALEKPIKIEKKAKNWVITHPISTLADQSMVTTFINTLTSYRYQKIISTSKNKWNSYGLDTPAIEVVFSSAHEKRTLYIGNKTPVGYEIYFRLDNKPDVYVGSQYLLTASRKSLFDFRSKSFFNYNESDLQTITYEGIKIDLTLQKVNGSWNIIHPKPYQADDDEILNFISELKSEKVEQFIDNPSKELLSALLPSNKATEKQLFLTVETNKGETEIYKFVTNEDTLFLSVNNRGLIYKLRKDFLDTLIKRLTDFRYKKLFTFNSDQAIRVTFNEQQFLKEDQTWIEASGKQNEQLAVFLVDLEYAKAVDFVTPDDISSDFSTSHKPKYQISVEFPDRSNNIKIAVWSHNSEYFLEHNSSKQLYRIDEDLANSFTKIDNSTKAPTAEGS